MLAIAGYASVVVWLITEESNLVSRASMVLGADRPPFAYTQVTLPRTDGGRQFAWVMRHGESDAGLWVIYLHGSATNVASSANISRYRVLHSAGLNVLAPEYRGFGGLEGAPDETSLQNDARAAYEYLRHTRRISTSRISVYGWSLGSAVAVDLAAHVGPAALMLEGAPSSLVDVAQRRYPFFPISLVMHRAFESISAVDHITCPILFLHSPADDVIPISEGRRLYRAAGERKMFVETRGRHFDASDVDRDHMSSAIRVFLQKFGVSGQTAGRPTEQVVR